MERKIYRQGDLILKQISENPQDFYKEFYKQYRPELIPRGGFNVEGERSGHAHVIQEAKTASTSTYPYGLRRNTSAQLVQVERETELVHPQHETLQIAPGVYIAYRIRDYRERLGGQGRVGD